MGQQSTAAGDTSVLANQDGLAVATRWFDRVVLIDAVGIVDALTAPRLTEAISAATAQSPDGVVIDLSKVEFFAAAGITVLLVAHTAIAPPVRFGVVAGGHVVSRPLTLLGVDEVIELYPTAADALNATGGAHRRAGRQLPDATPVSHG